MKSLSVQFNEDCNEYAGKFVFISYTTWRMQPTAIIALTAQVSLLINGDLVRNNYNTCLQITWTAIDMRAHYTKNKHNRA